MGTISTGPLVNSVMGPDMLLLGLPALIAVAVHDPLPWTTVLIQAGVGVGGALLYLRGTTGDDRTDLSH
jgi:hypothetical protein